MKSIGVIDIGTNTILCLKAAVERSNIHVVVDERFYYRAGQRLDDNDDISLEYKISMKNALISALKLLDDCFMIKIVATEVLRLPKDGAQFAKELSAEIGQKIEIIEPQREAELSFKGATGDLANTNGRVAVIDIGGGSTELAIGLNSRHVSWSSIHLGAVGISELVGFEKPPQDYLNEAARFFDNSKFPEILKPGAEQFIVVGGSAVALVGIMLGMNKFAAEKIQGIKIEERNLALLLDKLANLDLNQRKELMVFDPQRADIIVGGGAILLTFMRLFGVKQLSVSTRGLRHGLLSDYL
jgi:exopolyphosphatase / guanosine-5'-triphosphate,3'-diphosphate pyrophosphatase